VEVDWRGAGHGHGLSQYGAHGAAMHGLSMAQILSFYYPGTTLTTIAGGTIRVRLTNTAVSPTTVLANVAGLTLSGYAKPLPSGYTQFRLAPYQTGLKLLGLKAAKWTQLATGLPPRADFSSTPGWVQVLGANGSSIRYRGTVGAVRSGADVWTINRLGLDQYVEGSVPREMPASWESAALRAQAVAVRSYADEERAASGSGSLYDICDTTACQAYGGMAGYDRSGNLQWTDDPDALVGNRNTVLRYRGARVFAQYSASNGGATADGGQPYLVGKDDPYDSAASGDPYLDQTTTVTAKSLAQSFGLSTVTSIEITERDGNGPWGGRVVSGYVNGTTDSGARAHLATTGFGLGDAAGVWTDYLRFVQIEPTQTVPSAPTAVTATPGDAGARISWAPPKDDGGLAITSYRIRVGDHLFIAGPRARSRWVGPLSNRTPTTVQVRATNSHGIGPMATVTTQGVAAARSLIAVAPARLLDTGTTLVDPSHPYRFSVPGHGSIAASATSVQLAVTIRAASSDGVLTVAPAGVAAPRLSSIAYRKGRNATATVTVPLSPTGTVVFTPSAGHVKLWAAQEAYSPARGGSRVTVRVRQDIAVINGVPTGNGKLLSLDGRRGITTATTGVILAISARSPRPTWLRVWTAGTPAPTVEHVAVTPYASSANTVIVPVTSAHRLRISAPTRRVVARVTLVGTIARTGAGLVSFPAEAMTTDRVLKSAPVTLPLTGIGQIPASGVKGVLVQFTVLSHGRSGMLWFRPGPSAPPHTATAVRFAGTGRATGTVLVRATPSRTVTVQSSTPGVSVSADAIGYVS
jgi:peptidoglycan hydrolase-like amidase